MAALALVGAASTCGSTRTYPPPVRGEQHELGGSKAAANGAPGGLSVLDGWFAEAWDDHGSEVGWAIRTQGGESPSGAGDARDAELLYDVLEREGRAAVLRSGRDGAACPGAGSSG